MIVNVNRTLMGLKNVLTGYDVADGRYNGKSNKFVVFTYTDERAAFSADNRNKAIAANVNISIYTPENYNYLADKASIKNYLEDNGAQEISYMEFVEDEIRGTDYMRHQIFQATFTTT